MNLAKKIIIALIILIFIGAFSTSYSSLNLDKLIYVLAIGIDSAPNNQLEVTFQFSKPLLLNLEVPKLQKQQLILLLHHH